jgi:flavin-dependent dehydrogenase
MQLLLQKALDLGTVVRKDSRVETYTWEVPAVQIQSGETIQGDVVLIADGRG